MKLFYSPFHTFVHKVLVTAHECGHWERLERVPTFPFKNASGEDQFDAYDISVLNPLDKVPTLATAEGQVIFGSQAICEYFDATSTARRMYPEPGPKRWDAISRMALSDTIFETTVQMVMEQWKPADQWNRGLFEWLWPKFELGLNRLERDAVRGWDSFDVGHAAMLHAISYLGFRAEFYEAKDPINPNYNWRDGRPALSAWYDEAMTRPSVQSHYMKDFEGDSSAANCQRAVQEVLAAQRANGLA
jgi:glutathione S-transferase